MDIQVLKEAARVVLTFHRHAKAAADSGIDPVGSDQILAADEFFLVAAIGVREASRDAVVFESQILERRVVSDRPAIVCERVVADKGFGLALVVREDAVVAGIDGGVVEAGPDFGSLAVPQEMHDIALAAEVAIEDALAKVLADEVEKFNSARMHGDSAGFTAGAGHAVDASIVDAAAGELHGEDAPDGAATDNEDGDFGDFRHFCLA